MLIPATPPRRPLSGSRYRALNEGRDVNPGDTPERSPHDRLHAGRSTKAEMLIPATRRRGSAAGWRRGALNEGRDVNPGDTAILPDGGESASVGGEVQALSDILGACGHRKTP